MRPEVLTAANGIKAPKPLLDSTEISKAIQLLVEPNSVFELRLLEARMYNAADARIFSGYFDNLESALAGLTGIRAAKGIYITLNPVVPDLLAIRSNKLDAAKSGETTSDNQILKRRWLLIDCDPKRASPLISANDAELQAAIAKADAVEAYLAEHGFPAPVKAVSGNGAHLLYRIDLPTNDVGLIKNILTALAQKFDDGVVEIDKTVFNASRIVKLYGTLACKGADTLERPHRMSYTTNVPAELKVVDSMTLERFAATYVPPIAGTSSTAKSYRYQNNGKSTFDVREFLKKHNIESKREHRKDNKQVILLKTCPFNPDHGDHGDVTVSLFDDGKLGFKCQHSSCADKHWSEFRQHYEPECYSPRTQAIQNQTDPLTKALKDPRTKVRLPGENRLMSDFAVDLAKVVSEQGLFIRNGELVVLQNNKLKELKPIQFRTWVEKHAICYRVFETKGGVIQLDLTMSEDVAKAVLASPQFQQLLRPVQQLNTCQMPTLRANGKIELLPVGYDAESKTLTIAEIEYQTDMPLDQAKAIIHDLYSEYVFADSGRSKAVVIAGMVGLYANGLLPRLTLRPCFILTANAEGAGKTILATAMVMPSMGRLPTGIKPADEAEMNKGLLTVVKEGKQLVFLDNLKGYLSSSALEAFISAPVFEGRKLGVNEQITADNLATVLITGNGLSISPDVRRRSLFVELQLLVEHAEDREFRRPLSIPVLQGLRPKLLAALWSVVRHWDSQRRPKPTKTNSSFPDWSNVVGGIVESAGFGCPLETAQVALVADQDGDDIRTLVEAMAQAFLEKGKESYRFSELIDLAREQECFTGLVNDTPADPTGRKTLTAKATAKLGGLFKRYDKRQVGKYRFIIEGDHGKQRRNRSYKVEPIHEEVLP